MQAFDTPATVRAWSTASRRRGATIGLVPTMGALHAGHDALVRDARRRADLVVVSIFVNPLQFDRPDDFRAYPRPDDDVERCRSLGVDAVYAPTAAAMYPSGFQTHVEPGPLADRLEGAMRPGHFRGVATVVTKLFGAVAPDLAVFGEKDFQQLAIVRRMVADLDLGIDIVGAPTVREDDGLAMSSRNRRLDPGSRRAARAVPAALRAAAASFDAGARSAEAIEQAARAVLDACPLARIDDVALVDPDTLEAERGVTARSRLLVAVWFGDVRLIDNCALGDAPLVET
jgi:pantoate--beta-alanine ligase